MKLSSIPYPENVCHTRWHIEQPYTDRHDLGPKAGRTRERWTQYYSDPWVAWVWPHGL